MPFTPSFQDRPWRDDRMVRAEGLYWRARRRAFIAQVRALARARGASVDIDVAWNVQIGRRVRVEILPGTDNVLHIGRRSLIGNDVLMMLKGGEIRLGPRSDVRSRVVLNVAGRLTLEGENPLSWGTAVHCADEIVLEQMVGLAENVTVADSTHFFTEPDAFFYHNVRTAPVRVRRNTWLCPKVTVTSGVEIGSHCIIGSNSVVTSSIPSGSLASGIPAKVIRQLPLPWLDFEDEVVSGGFLEGEASQ
jgi:acetyltransferase-like isoleucine patch superfamily enzyme